MGCFSYLCNHCKTPINSDSFNGEKCDLFLIKDGIIQEHMTGSYDSYGRVFGDDWASHDWTDIVDLHFNENPLSGIAAFHHKCLSQCDYTNLMHASDNDPNQGWGDLREEFL